MDNPLTPNKIKRLLHLAEDKSFNTPYSKRTFIDQHQMDRAAVLVTHKNPVYSEDGSSGILDLANIEGFGESGVGTDISLSSFNPGEMTGRYTDAEVGATSAMSRHNEAIDNLTTQLDKQTLEINNLMRNSICSNYTFHSKRDLTADEMSYVMREAPLPTMAAPVSINDCSVTSVNSTVTSYLRKKCPDLGSMLGNMDSPDRSMFPSISEVSYQGIQEAAGSTQLSHHLDQSLDSVPIKQPRTNSEISQTVRPTFVLTKNLDVSKSQSENIDPKSPKKILKQTENDIFKVPMTINMKTPSKAVQSVRPTNAFVKKLESDLRQNDGNTETSELESLSVSRIAEVLGRQSNLSISDIINMQLKQKQSKKQPLSEIDINSPIKQTPIKDFVVPLIDSKKTDTASSAGTINTVISNKPMHKISEIPDIVVCQASFTKDNVSEISKTQKTGRSKSPSSKSQSTMSTVQEQMTSFKIDSPLHSSRGEQNTSHIPSPNVQYKELDKSIDWCEILQPKLLQEEGFKVVSEMEWAEIKSSPVTGFAGASSAANITITTLTDNWLTANIKFHKVPRDLNIEIPRQPFLLSPRKTELLTLHVTSNVEIIQTLPFTLQIKDASIDKELEQKGFLEIEFKMPVIQALSIDGMNKLNFPTIQEMLAISKTFVLISDCPVDLQLVLTVVEGDSMFFIRSVQEIKKSEVNKILNEKQIMEERGNKKGTSRQLCKLSSGNAIKVTVTFHAPKLVDLNLTDEIATMNGALNVNLLDVRSVLKKIDLSGVVGTACLKLQSIGDRLLASSEGTTLNVTNTGTVNGTWVVKRTRESELFRVNPQTFEIAPGAQKAVVVAYTAADDGVYDGVLHFVNTITGKETTVQVTTGKEKPKAFPLKTNHLEMSWVRSGRKEISFKNFTGTKIQIRCEIIGEGFAIDFPGLENRGVFSLVFGPMECKRLNVVFSPINQNLPHKATLHMSYGKNSDFSKKISFYGCESPNRVRWSGLVTYESAAFLRAELGAPIVFRLQNKAHTAAFVAARVQFGLHYTSIEPTCRISGARNIIPARSTHTVTLQLDWSKVERRARHAPAATVLATVTVLTGAELTRRRILRVLRETSKTAGATYKPLLPDRLQVITGKFDGEDSNNDQLISDFNESKESLEELYTGLVELTAQIDLPQDFSDSTILITDETVTDHKTICE